MEAPKSPLFPAASLTLNSGPHDAAYTPQLPETPTFQTSSLQLYIVPTEKQLFVQGFKASEYEQRPPTLLRGCLVLRVLKPCKIKTLTLSFRGVQKTDWPEGIPPKRNTYAEVNDLVNHSWPFYNHENPVADFGADMFVAAGRGRVDESEPVELQMSPLLMPPAANGANGAASSFMSSLVRKAASSLSAPAPGMGLTPVSSFHDLTAVLSGSSQTDVGKAACAAPGDYVYNFEHPIPASSPETTQVNFGSVHYYLEASLTRQTTFKSSLSGRHPVKVVRIPCDNSVEENEPIVIERDWEDQLRYEIVIGSKSVVLDSFLPLSLKFIPLYGKVAVHRIRVYVTEDCNYYCNGKSVHRTEPSRKYLLLEHKAGKNESLLQKNGGHNDGTDEILPRELEFQMYVPSVINKKNTFSIHPDTAVENIQCTHWIKISLRISRQDLQNPEKRKHFEISIDSPIHLHSPLAAHNLTLLPKYNSTEFLPQYSKTPLASPGVTAIDASDAALGSLMQNANSPSIEFHHINSISNNDDPIERDELIHLESNLYKPEDPAALDAIGSPQATPYTPAVSPIASPHRRAPQPSTDPPAFDAADSSTSHTLPPAYRQDTPSLSPLRLDSGPEGGIKDKLFRQLDNFEGDARSTRSSETRSSGWSSNQSVEESSKTGGSSEKSDSPRGRSESMECGNSIKESQRSDVRVGDNPEPQQCQGSHVKKDTHVPEPQCQASQAEAMPELDMGAGFSRNSSVTSAIFQNTFDESVPVELTIPLLKFSSASNEDGIGRSAITDSMTDLAPTSFEGFSIRNSLRNFENPRLSKHYHEKDDMVESVSKQRQKSFGVVPDIPSEPVSGPDSDGSTSTIDEYSDVKMVPNNIQHVLSR